MKEYFEFPDNLPVQVSVRKIDEYPIHMHDSMEIIYVLEGEIELKVSFHHYELKKGQLIIVNNHEIHYIRKKVIRILFCFLTLTKRNMMLRTLFLCLILTFINIIIRKK